LQAAVSLSNAVANFAPSRTFMALSTSAIGEGQEGPLRRWRPRPQPQRRASAYVLAGGWRYQSPSRIASLYGNLGWKSTEAKVHLLTSEVDNFFGP
jgi:hypothetical protein